MLSFARIARVETGCEKTLGRDNDRGSAPCCAGDATYLIDGIIQSLMKAFQLFQT
jgi:hypothetical protein